MTGELPAAECPLPIRDLGSDDEWMREIAADRATIEITDPWEAAQ